MFSSFLLPTHHLMMIIKRNAIISEKINQSQHLFFANLLQDF